MGEKKGCGQTLLCGDHVIINRLPAIDDTDLGIGEVADNGFGGAVGLLLRDILAVVDGNELGMKIINGPAEFLKERPGVGIAADQASIE